jgi:hypothetical protein
MGHAAVGTSMADECVRRYVISSGVEARVDLVHDPSRG